VELTDRLIRAARAAWGHRAGDPTELWRLGLYPARVDACAADGSTVDVTPDDARLTPQNAVPVRFGVPGAAAVLPSGARCLIGWQGGDPAKVYAVPSWESTTPSKLVLSSTLIEAAGSGYAAVLDTIIGDLKTWVTAVNAVLASNCVNGAPLTAQPVQAATLAAFVTSLNVAGAYKSTKLKHG